MQYTGSFANYTKELSGKQYEPLSFEEERKLLSLSAKGVTAAFDRLVCAHLRFVVYLLRSYKIPSHVDIMDVIQEGNVGFIIGLRKFKYEKYNCRVFTYCIYWVKFYISKELSSHQETSDVLCCPECSYQGDATTTKNVSKRTCPSCGSNLKYLKAVFEPVEGQETLVNEEVTEHYEQVAKDIVKHTFNFLPSRERAILAMFFGLTPPYVPKTLQEIGSMLHMHIERVRQLKESALKKVKKRKGLDALVE